MHQSVIDVGDIAGRSILFPALQLLLAFLFAIEFLCQILYDLAAVKHRGFGIFHNLHQCFPVILRNVRQLRQKFFRTALVDFNERSLTHERTVGNGNAEQVLLRALPERVCFTAAARVRDNGLTESNDTLVIDIPCNWVVDFLYAVPSIGKVEVDEVKYLHVIPSGFQQFPHVVVDFAFRVRNDY